MLANQLIIYVSVFIVAFFATALVRLYAMKRKVVDMPSSRSSHAEPTPRGGGLSMVVATLTGLIISIHYNLMPANILWLMAPGVFLSLICFWDDHRHISFPYRLLAQAISIVVLLILLGGADWFTLGAIPLHLFFLGSILLGFFSLWFLNLYNFMDGINGIATLETLSICAGTLVLSLMLGLTGTYDLLSLILLAAACGFLFWNFPVARIFMGDVGSVFCGYCIILIMLLAGDQHPPLFWSLLTLSGVFVVDASLTLLVRLLRRDKIWQAHRTHAYQNLARRWQSHTKVSLSVVAINMAWLLPIAILIATGKMSGPLGVVIAYLPLFATAWLLRAGKVDVI